MAAGGGGVRELIIIYKAELLYFGTIQYFPFYFASQIVTTMTEELEASAIMLTEPADRISDISNGEELYDRKICTFCFCAWMTYYTEPG